MKRRTAVQALAVIAIGALVGKAQVREGPIIYEPGINAEFEPQPDITAYELSIILPYMLGARFGEPEWKKLGPATRHLKRTKPAHIVGDPMPSGIRPK